MSSFTYSMRCVRKYFSMVRPSMAAKVRLNVVKSMLSRAFSKADSESCEGFSWRTASTITCFVCCTKRSLAFSISSKPMA